MNCSQFQRSFRSLKPTQAARALAPITKSFAPNAVRFASTDAARDGKIYQVIGELDNRKLLILC